jgi:hypothetical protein
MSPEEVRHWRYFFAINGPVGDDRLDRNAAMIACTVARGYADREKWQPVDDDFVLKFKRTSTKKGIKAIEELVDPEKDMETLERRFGGRRSGVSGGFAAPAPCLLLGKGGDSEKHDTEEG